MLPQWTFSVKTSTISTQWWMKASPCAMKFNAITHKLLESFASFVLWFDLVLHAEQAGRDGLLSLHREQKQKLWGRPVIDNVIFSCIVRIYCPSECSLLVCSLTWELEKLSSGNRELKVFLKEIFFFNIVFGLLLLLLSLLLLVLFASPTKLVFPFPQKSNYQQLRTTCDFINTWKFEIT